jgi:hypothetical protein
MIQCDTCKRQWRLAPHRLHDRFDDKMFLTEIQRTMRCARCGGTTMLWWVVRATPL